MRDACLVILARVCKERSQHCIHAECLPGFSFACMKNHQNVLRARGRTLKTQNRVQAKLDRCIAYTRKACPSCKSRVGEAVLYNGIHAEGLPDSKPRASKRKEVPCMHAEGLPKAPTACKGWQESNKKETLWNRLNRFWQN